MSVFLNWQSIVGTQAKKRLEENEEAHCNIRYRTQQYIHKHIRRAYTIPGMSGISLGASPNKRQRKDTTAKKNAFDIMLDSSKLCWPSGDAPSHMPILQMVAENRWFPWNDNEANGQNPDYSNLRLVSKDMKIHLENPTHGGPDFESIVSFLDLKNGFDDDEGFCNHCFSGIEGEDVCDTCGDIDGECNYDSCKCKKSHRYGPVLMKLDPRLNPNVKFRTLPLRTRAKLLLQFLRQVASNFHAKYYDEWIKIKLKANGYYMDWVDGEPDLTMISTGMIGGDLFNDQMKEYNLPFYNFIHHLLFTGWADNDCYTSPGTRTPFRGRLIGDGEDYNDWNGGHREWFGEMLECFLCLHKSDEEKTIPQQSMLRTSWERQYTLSQIQYLPETIRRCVMNCVDKEAEGLLGKSIADSIDIYRLVMETYHVCEDELKIIQWMPCFGVPISDFEPMDTFEGYNPLNERFGKVADNIDCTGLRWGLESDDKMNRGIFSLPRVLD